MKQWYFAPAVRGVRTYGYVYELSETGERIAIANTGTDGNERGPVLAAAPELYAILSQMTEWAGGIDSAKLPAPWWPEIVEKARAVLARVNEQMGKQAQV